MNAPFRHRFLARPPFFGGVMQTLRGVGWPLRPMLPTRGHQLWIPLGDGDQLAAVLHWPKRTRRPLALLVHGLVGTAAQPVDTGGGLVGKVGPGRIECRFHAWLLG